MKARIDYFINEASCELWQRISPDGAQHEHECMSRKVAEFVGDSAVRTFLRYLDEGGDVKRLKP